MSKRILSMFLVVVMLILAVPVFALPSLAGGAAGPMGNSLLTSSTLSTESNWPYVQATDLANGQAGAWDIWPAGRNGTLFGEGWNFGIVLEDGTFAPNLATNTQYATLNDDPLNPWNSSLLYLGGADAAKVSAGVKGQTMGFAWVAPAEGVLDLNFAFGIWANGAASIEGYGIMVDGKLVWPAQPTEEGAAPVWGTIEAGNYNDDIKNIAVKAGSTVAFVWKMKTSGNGDGLLRFYSASCTYTSIVESTGANYTVDLGVENRNGGAFTTSYPSWWLEFEKRSELVFNGHFTIGHYDEVGNYILIDKPNAAANWFSSSVEDSLWGGDSNAGYMITSRGVCPTREEVVIRYTAEYTGKITPSITNFAHVGDSNCTGTALYSIAVNNEVVWPAECTDWSDAETAFVATPSDTTQDWKALMNAAMAETSISVNAGDRVDFIMRRGTTWNSVKVTPAYTYTEIDYTVPLTFNFVNAEAGTSEAVMVTPNPDGTVNFTAPDAGDTLGWFEIDASGNIIDANAYQGAILSEGKTFYAFSETATLQPGKSWPQIANGKVLYPSTIGFGKYNQENVYTPFTTVAGNGQFLTGGGQWGDAGSFLYVNENRFITTPKGAVTVNWTALVDGKVEVDFLKLSIDRNSDGPKNEGNSKDNPSPMHSDTAFVIVHNGMVVWPKAAAGVALDVKEGVKGAEGTWYYAELPDLAEAVESYSGNGAYWTKAATGDLLAGLDAYLADEANDDALPTIDVKAGDNVQIVFAKIGTNHISVNAAVNYVEVAEDAELWDGIVTEVAMYTSAQGDNKPTDTWTTEARDQLTATFHGNWTAVGYKNNEFGDLTKEMALNSLINFQKKENGKSVVTTPEEADGNGDTFYSVAGSYLGNYPAVRAHGGGDYWGADGMALSTPGNMMAGWVYTAEYSGLVDLTFVKANNIGPADKNVSLAVFVNGNMVWPTAGGVANKAEGTSWHEDWQVLATGENAATLNADAGLKNILVSKGDRVEFMICGDGDTYGNKVVLSPAVSYNTLATTPIAPQMSVSYEGDFGITVSLPYGFTQVVSEDSIEAAKVTINDEVYNIEESEWGWNLSATAKGFAAKNLVDEFTWSFDITVNGKEINVGKGTTSAVEYLYALLESDMGYEEVAIRVLNYVAAAQTYFGYKTDALANAGLTEEQKTLPDNDAESVLDKETTDGASATIDGFTLLLQDKVIIKTFVQAENAEGL